MKKYLSDIIGDDYKEWRNLVFLAAGTGAGKSYFVVNILGEYVIRNNLRMAILVPRKSLHEKYVQDYMEMLLSKKLLDRKEFISIMTYQELEYKISHCIPLPTFDYYIMDEAHYFHTDASFNSNSWLSFKYICDVEECTAKVFISATGNFIFNYVREYVGIESWADRKEMPSKEYRQHMQGQIALSILKFTYWQYDMPRDYSYLEIKYIPKNMKLENLVQYDPSGKWIFFVNSKLMGEKLQNALEEEGYTVDFLTSDNYSSQTEVVNTITQQEKICKQILIATAVIDVGINFKGREINNVVIFSDNQEQFIQMLGRKRRMYSDEKVNLFIPQHSVEYFVSRQRSVSTELSNCNRIIYQMKNAASIMDFLYENGDDVEYIKHMIPKLYGGCAIENINQLYLCELQRKKHIYKSLIEEMNKDEEAFIKMQLGWIDSADTFRPENYASKELRKKLLADFQLMVEEIPLEEEIPKDEMKKTLQQLAKLVKKINSKFLSKEIFSLKNFNNFCNEYEIMFHMESNSTKEGTTYTLKKGYMEEEKDDKGEKDEEEN